MVSPPEPPGTTGDRSAATERIVGEHHRNTLIGAAVVILTVAVVVTFAYWAWQAQGRAECLAAYTQGVVTALQARDRVIDDNRAADIAVNASGRDTLTRILESVPADGRTPSAAQILAARGEIERYIPRVDEHITALNTARTAARTYPLPAAGCFP